MAIREVSKAKRGGSSAKAKPDGSSAEPSSIESQTTPGTDASGGAEDRSRTATAPERRRVHWRLADKPDAIQTRVLHEAAIATLDKFNRGILLLNPGGAVCFVNRAAEAMLARNDGLRIHRGRLELEAADARADLAAFLAAGGGAADRSSLVLRGERTPERPLSGADKSPRTPSWAPPRRYGPQRVHLRAERRPPPGARIRVATAVCAHGGGSATRQ
jgi:PAS domain-containing protein